MAMLMGEFPEVGIFRRFGALNAQNLLYLQAELKDLEITLRQVAEEDELSRDPDKVQYSVNWFALKESIEGEADSNDGKQWRTILEIRDKLKEYSNISLGLYDLACRLIGIRLCTPPAKCTRQVRASQISRPNLSTTMDATHRHGQRQSPRPRPRHLVQSRPSRSSVLKGARRRGSIH